MQVGEQTKAPCRACARSTLHNVLHRSDVEPLEEDGTASEDYLLLQCAGCRTISMRHELHIEADGGEENQAASVVNFYPPPIFRREPNWLVDLNETDRDLLREVYVALQNNLSRLAIMGLRAALEHLMIELNGDKGTFTANLDALVECGAISVNQREVLEVVIDAGSATIHRGFQPERQDLESVLDISELVFRQTFVDGPKAAELRRRIPPRPPRP